MKPREEPDETQECSVYPGTWRLEVIFSLFSKGGSVKKPAAVQYPGVLFRLNSNDAGDVVA
jgi:hypothetical protein